MVYEILGFLKSLRFCKDFFEISSGTSKRFFAISKAFSEFLDLRDFQILRIFKEFGDRKDF